MNSKDGATWVAKIGFIVMTITQVLVKISKQGNKE